MCHSYDFSVVCYLFLFYIFNTYFIVRSSVSAFGLFIVKLLVYFLKFSVYALHISQFFIASCFHSVSFYFFGRLIKQFYCFLVVVVLPYYIIVFMTVLEPTNVQFAAHKSSFQTNTYIKILTRFCLFGKKKIRKESTQKSKINIKKINGKFKKELTLLFWDPALASSIALVSMPCISLAFFLSQAFSIGNFIFP